MTERFFQAQDGMKVISSTGEVLALKGVNIIGDIPEGDWVMAVMFKTIIVLADRSGKNLPYIIYKDQMEQMKI